MSRTAHAVAHPVNPVPPVFLRAPGITPRVCPDSTDLRLRCYVPQAPQSLAEALRDRYAFEREIGHGGMATVYLARDLKHDRSVALKVLHPHLAVGAERFLREIQISARLQHPHILPLIDSGQTAGFLYYVMPYVKGESLRERLAREGELPVPEAVRILREVVDALGHAHEEGVIHRDVKPEGDSAAPATA